MRIQKYNEQKTMYNNEGWTQIELQEICSFEKWISETSRVYLRDWNIMTLEIKKWVSESGNGVK